MKKLIPLFEEFVNEAIQFGKKGIKAKAQQKVEIAQMAYDKWGDSYLKTLNAMKKLAKDGKLPSYKEHINVQGSGSQDNYDIFIGRNAALLAFQIEKVIKKYKKHEVEKSSAGAAGGWSGTMRSTIGGEIEGRSNFSPGSRNSYLIAVTCGSGIDLTIKDKLFQEIYELIFVYDEFNGSDGGVSVSYESGSNYSTIGLTNSSYQLSSKTANSIIGIMNESASTINEAASFKVTKKNWPNAEVKYQGKKYKIEFDDYDMIDDHGNEGKDLYFMGVDQEGGNWEVDVYANYNYEVEEIHWDTLTYLGINESKLTAADIKYSMELAFDETYNAKALKKVSKKGKDISLNMSSYMSPETLETYNIIGKFNEIMGTSFKIVPGSFQKGNVTNIILSEK